jgi:hypothetical protein
MSVESLVVEASSRVASGSFDIRKSLIHVFENSELDDILLAIQRCPTVSKFFCNIETVRAIVDFVFESGPPPPPLEYEPPPSPSSPRKEQEEQKEEEKVRTEKKFKKKKKKKKKKKSHENKVPCCGSGVSCCCCFRHLAGPNQSVLLGAFDEHGLLQGFRRFDAL